MSSDIDPRSLEFRKQLAKELADQSLSETMPCYIIRGAAEIFLRPGDDGRHYPVVFRSKTLADYMLTLNSDPDSMFVTQIQLDRWQGLVKSNPDWTNVVLIDFNGEETTVLVAVFDKALANFSGMDSAGEAQSGCLILIAAITTTLALLAMASCQIG